MGIWDTIVKLSKEILGDSAPKPSNFSKIEKAIVPEHGKRQVKKYTSTVAPLNDIEVLPEYKFIYEALQQGCPSLFVTGKAGTGKSTLIPVSYTHLTLPTNRE